MSCTKTGRSHLRVTLMVSCCDLEGWIDGVEWWVACWLLRVLHHSTPDRQNRRQTGTDKTASWQISDLTLLETLYNQLHHLTELLKKTKKTLNLARHSKYLSVSCTFLCSWNLKLNQELACEQIKCLLILNASAVGYLALYLLFLLSKLIFDLN